MNRSIIASFAIGTLVAGITVFALQPLTNDSAANAANSETYRQLNLFGDVFERVRADYVEPTEDSELIDNAINGMLQSLDPHSSYLNPKNFRDMQVQTRGEFGGLGIEVTMENGLIKVVTPIDDTPAQKAGLLPNDLITHLDDTPILGLTLGESVEKMRGPVDTTISLTVLREGVDEPFDVKVTRDIITIRSVRFERDDDIGYIRITSFNEQTSTGLDDAIEELSELIGEDRLKGYVLDLRNNPGGLLDQAIAVSDAFLDKGEIVSTRGRRTEETQRYNARGGDKVDGKPVIVLINGGSASASEIVAGALQDHQRATVLGTRSFGKGSVQTIIPLGSDGAIRLTTARYFTPSGTSIQATGIEPDIEVHQEVDDERQRRITGEAALPGHLQAENGKEEAAGSPSYVPADRADDLQLQYALDLLNGVRTYEVKANTEDQSATVAN
ncbi:MAG: peptidase S41 [Parvibaculum sp.]|jgi:carboxyl-terminal processing protease|nr:peptidase S41 [Parvibaculum sp.]|tara:strand:+ start:5183 stop:6511 length:1329 start_codon:yes stop_codon:yes gene_type:complete